MSVFVGGLIGMIAFYLVILVVGLISGRKSGNNVEDTFLGGRSFGIVLGSLTLTATWYGGGFVNGMAEAIANPYYGLTWTVAPWSYGLSMAVGGILVGKTMRERKYVTVIDPLQEQYGPVMGIILLIPQVIGDILYISTILLALGSTVSVILGVGLIPSIIGSVTIVVIYTFFGGLTSVVWTDLVQLPCILIGLVLTIPFAASNPAVSDIMVDKVRWTGVWPHDLTAVWIDTFLSLLVGAIPVQGYLQRCLAAKTPNIAVVTCILGSVGVLLFAIPPLFIGAIGAKTDWYQTGYAEFLPPISANNTNGTLYPFWDYSLTLPLVIRYLTPTWVGVFALGAVSAAVMSSMDSSFIAIASEISCNLYKNLIRPKASEREMVWVLRVTVVVAAVAATAIALSADSIYALFYLLGDFNGIVMFPQLVCAVRVKNVNTYGSLFSLIIGVILRIGGGDAFIGIPAFIKYPYYSEIYGQLFPFKTFAIVLAFVILVGVSYLAKFLFEREILPAKLDIFHCFQQDDDNKQEENISLKSEVKETSTKI